MSLKSCTCMPDRVIDLKHVADLHHTKKREELVRLKVINKNIHFRIPFALTERSCPRPAGIARSIPTRSAYSPSLQ